MARERIKVVQRKAKPHILHEVNEKAQHRLVLVGEEGNDTSRWFEAHQVGEFRGCFFSAGCWPLKPGVFRQSMVEARHLSGGQNSLADCAMEAKTQIEPLRRRR